MHLSAEAVSISKQHNFIYPTNLKEQILVLNLQVLNAHSKFVVIPRKLMIGKRLSQCMHPALPSGVHLKALETYNLIFERIGKKRLSQDLFIYSVGLFPLMSHSAMSVKPLLMKLYEEHFLPLGVALIPSLPGLVLGLLPGIEEGSDYTERYNCITSTVNWSNGSFIPHPQRKFPLS